MEEGEVNAEEADNTNKSEDVASTAEEVVGAVAKKFEDSTFCQSCDFKSKSVNGLKVHMRRQTDISDMNMKNRLFTFQQKSISDALPSYF